MMLWRRVGFGAVLAASLGANAYLLLTDKPAAQAHASVGHRAIPVVHRVHHDPVPPPKSVDVSPEIAALDDQTLRARVADAEKRLDAVLPLFEKFDRSEPAPELESRIRPILEDTFVTDDGKVAPFDLECRGEICRIENVGLDNWRMIVQQEFAMNTEGMEVGESVYAKMASGAVVGSRSVAQQLFGNLLLSADVKACKKPDSHKGRVSIGFVIDPSAHAAHAVAEGSLANDPFGVCIRNVADSIASRVTIPPNVTELPDWTYPFEVP